MEINASQRKKPSILQTVHSVLAAAFGVQSNRNRERDFSHGSSRAFILAGLVGTVTFIAVLIIIVRLVLRAAG